MTIEELINVQRAEPFQPYEIVVADGAVYRVDHPDFVARAANGRTITVYEGNAARILDMRLVTQIRLIDNEQTGGKTSGRNGS